MNDEQDAIVPIEVQIEELNKKQKEEDIFTTDYIEQIFPLMAKRLDQLRIKNGETAHWVEAIETLLNSEEKLQAEEDALKYGYGYISTLTTEELANVLPRIRVEIDVNSNTTLNPNHFVAIMKDIESAGATNKLARLVNLTFINHNINHRIESMLEQLVGSSENMEKISKSVPVGNEILYLQSRIIGKKQKRGIVYCKNLMNAIYQQIEDEASFQFADLADEGKNVLRTILSVKTLEFPDALHTLRVPIFRALAINDIDEARRLLKLAITEHPYAFTPTAKSLFEFSDDEYLDKTLERSTKGEIKKGQLVILNGRECYFQGISPNGRSLILVSDTPDGPMRTEKGSLYYMRAIEYSYKDLSPVTEDDFIQGNILIFNNTGEKFEIEEVEENNLNITRDRPWYIYTIKMRSLKTGRKTIREVYNINRFPFSKLKDKSHG